MEGRPNGAVVASGARGWRPGWCGRNHAHSSSRRDAYQSVPASAGSTGVGASRSGNAEAYAAERCYDDEPGGTGKTRGKPEGGGCSLTARRGAKGERKHCKFELNYPRRVSAATTLKCP